MSSKYIGLNHYRRYFDFTDNIPDIDEIFKDYDIILNYPLRFPKSIKDHYCDSHICANYEEILEIIKNMKPEYYETALKTATIKDIYFCDMFIMKKKDFFKYCEFMLDILFEFDRRHNFQTDEDVLNYVKQFFPEKKDYDYQCRLQSFLSERLSNIFFYNNYKKIKHFGMHG